MAQARQVQVAARQPTPVQFGRTHSADFEANTLTVEMDPGYIVAVGPVAILPRETYDDLLVALQQLAEEKVDYMRINHLGDPEQTHCVKLARTAIARATGASQ